MQLRLASLALYGTLATGCSLILDTGDLPNASDAPIPDAPPLPPDAMLPDADPTMISVRGTEPMELHDGDGSDGGRPVVLLIDAPNLVSTATLVAAWEEATTDPDIIVEETVVSGARQHAALVLRVPVLPELDAGQTRNLVVTISQAGIDIPITIPVRGHDELTISAPITTSPNPHAGIYYSTITITGNVVVSGNEPLVLHATGSITLDGTLDASAVGNTNTGRPGPGGCAGGAGGTLVAAPGQPGGCTPGGGGGGGETAPGSGGSFGTEGGGGAPGMLVGNAMLVPLVPSGSTANRGNGGGGGGALLGLGAVAGAAAGNGGGVLALYAGGTFHVTSGALRANGSPGSASLLSGDGGSGSGGAIFVRSTGQIGATGTWATATGASAAESGGAGGAGRVRVDSPSGSVGADPGATYGPAWATDVPAIVTDPSPRLTAALRATAGCYGIVVPTMATLVEAGADPCTSGANMFDRTLPGDVEIDLAFGHNRLCARYTRAALAIEFGALEEASSCVDVVWLPQ
jgi:hypothetical protein